MLRSDNKYSVKLQLLGIFFYNSTLAPIVELNNKYLQA